MALFSYDTTGFPSGFEARTEYYGYNSKIFPWLRVWQTDSKEIVASQWCYPGYYGILWTPGDSLLAVATHIKQFVNEKYASAYDSRTNTLPIRSEDFLSQISQNLHQGADFSAALETAHFTAFIEKFPDGQSAVGINSPELFGSEVASELFDATADDNSLRIKNRFFEVIRPAIEQTLAAS